jgi:hypothetical protein
MASLSAAHKRGGTHRVKDEHRTNTIFDEWDYKQLKNECIARKIWIKDSKKHEMAIALAKDDQHKKRAERDAIVQHERRKQELEREKQLENDRRLKADAAKHRKRMRKEARRDRGESVSDDTPDEDELRVMHEMAGNDVDRGYQAAVGGHALSEESWESTLTESSFCSTNQGIGPGCRLRLFEWSYLGMPSDVSWSATSTRLTEDRENVKYTVALSGRDIGKSLSGTDEEESSALDSPTADEERDISESSTGTESESSSPASPTTTEEGTEPAPRKIPYAPLKHIHQALTPTSSQYCHRAHATPSATASSKAFCAKPQSSEQRPGQPAQQSKAGMHACSSRYLHATKARSYRKYTTSGP